MLFLFVWVSILQQEVLKRKSHKMLFLEIFSSLICWSFDVRFCLRLQWGWETWFCNLLAGKMRHKKGASSNVYNVDIREKTCMSLTARWTWASAHLWVALHRLFWSLCMRLSIPIQCMRLLPWVFKRSKKLQVREKKELLPMDPV